MLSEGVGENGERRRGMKMVMILAMVGVITLIVCAMLAFVFFFVGMIDELGVEDKVHEEGQISLFD